MQLHSVWIFANFFWSSTMAKDGGHLRVRGLQIDSAFSSVDLVLGAFDDVLASKKTGGSKDKGKDDPKSACCAGKPTSLLFFFTGKNCFETLTSGLFEQGDKSSCIPEGPTQPTLLDFPYEIMAESNTGGDAVRIPIDRTKTFQVQFPSNKFESGTILTVYKNGTEFQKVEIHTSCSRTLNLGSEWGAFKLVNYGPRPTTGICADTTPPSTVPPPTNPPPVFCNNTYQDGKVDFGCKKGCPLCAQENLNGTVSKIPINAAGNTCEVCLNDARETVIDSGCPWYSPVCPVGIDEFGDECVFCKGTPSESFDDGCSPEFPFCNADEDGGEGTACFKCQHVPGEPGCHPGEVCVGLPGRFGKGCAPCVDDDDNIRNDTSIIRDSGCVSDESPVCLPNLYDPHWKGGQGCVYCINNEADPMVPDSGCSVKLPLCVGLLGPLGYLEDGIKCAKCINTKHGNDNDFGCPTTDNPRCLAKEGKPGDECGPPLTTTTTDPSTSTTKTDPTMTVTTVPSTTTDPTTTTDHADPTTTTDSTTTTDRTTTTDPTATTDSTSTTLESTTGSTTTDLTTPNTTTDSTTTDSTTSESTTDSTASESTTPSTTTDSTTTTPKKASESTTAVTTTDSTTGSTTTDSTTGSTTTDSTTSGTTSGSTTGSTTSESTTPGTPSFTTESTTSITGSPVCRIPTPTIPEDTVENVTQCALNTTLSFNNTIILLQDHISCVGDGGGGDSFFLKITGDNNTVDCRGNSVDGNGTVVFAFQFQGNNNIIQNCPDISRFLGRAVDVFRGSLLVFNVSASENSVGLLNTQGEVYVDGSDFSRNGQEGIEATGSNATDGNPFQFVLRNSIITNNNFIGVSLSGFGDACLEDNVITGNDIINVAIFQSLEISGTPNVRLTDINACDPKDNQDIFDDTNGVTSVVGTILCDSVSEGFDGTNFILLNATVYGCTPCPPILTTTATTTTTTTTTALTTTTSTSTDPSGCQYPPPEVPEPYESVRNLTTCVINPDLEVSNSLIQLQSDINCNDDDRAAFLNIIGDNNTVDCNEFSVVNSGSVEVAFTFVGNNNIIRNCPEISGFTRFAIEAFEGSLYVFNVTGNGLRDEQGTEVYVDDSDFSQFDVGIIVFGSNATDGTPFKLVVKNSVISNNSDTGVEMAGFGDACLQDNVISGNGINIRITSDSDGTPNVKMVNINACDSENADIDDNTDGATIVENVTCDNVETGNATAYGCDPCT